MHTRRQGVKYNPINRLRGFSREQVLTTKVWHERSCANTTRLTCVTADRRSSEPSFMGYRLVSNTKAQGPSARKQNTVRTVNQEFTAVVRYQVPHVAEGLCTMHCILYDDKSNFVCTRTFHECQGITVDLLGCRILVVVCLNVSFISYSDDSKLAYQTEPPHWQ